LGPFYRRVERLKSLRFKDQGSRFKVQSSKFKVQGSRFKVQGSRFKVESPLKRGIIIKSKN